MLLAELALRGRFCEVDEPLFLWRDHAQRATRACNSDAELAAWFSSGLNDQSGPSNLN